MGAFAEAELREAYASQYRPSFVEALHPAGHSEHHPDCVEDGCVCDVADWSEWVLVLDDDAVVTLAGLTTARPTADGAPLVRGRGNAFLQTVMLLARAAMERAGRCAPQGIEIAQNIFRTAADVPQLRPGFGAMHTAECARRGCECLLDDDADWYKWHCRYAAPDAAGETFDVTIDLSAVPPAWVLFESDRRVLMGRVDVMPASIKYLIDAAFADATKRNRTHDGVDVPVPVPPPGGPAPEAPAPEAPPTLSRAEAVVEIGDTFGGPWWFAAWVAGAESPTQTAALAAARTVQDLRRILIVAYATELRNRCLDGAGRKRRLHEMARHLNVPAVTALLTAAVAVR